MKIAIVHYGEDIPTQDGYRPLRYGRFAERWTEAGDDVVRIAPSFSHLQRSSRPAGESTSPAEGLAVAVRTTGYTSSRSLKRLLFLLQFSVRSVFELRRQRPDVCLLGYPPPGLLVLSRILRLQCPIVVDVRDLWFDHRLPHSRASRGRIIGVLSWLVRREIRMGDAVVALSENIDDWLGANDTIVAPIGVEALEAAGERNPGPVRAVFVGTLNRRFALREVVDGWPDGSGGPELTIAGNGPELDDLRARAESNPNVHVVGAVLPDQVPELLLANDVGVVPTMPGFGTVLSNKVCEYLAAGLMVVHSLEPGPSEQLESDWLGERAHRHAEFGEVVSSLDVAVLDAERAARQELAAERFGAGAVASTVYDVLKAVSDRPV